MRSLAKKFNNVSDNLFWETKSLHEMNNKEWESLCDGCGKCCLIKLEDIETKDLSYTDVACHLLDSKTCQCKNYAKRKDVRLLHEGKSLPNWHHLICGDRNAVHKNNMSVKNRVVTETEVLEIAEHIVYWV